MPDQIRKQNDFTPVERAHPETSPHCRPHRDLANFYNLLNVINICLLLLLFSGYSYPAVPQFSFTLFINELLLCLAETLPICCCSVVVAVVVVIYYMSSICRFAMLIALKLNAFTFTRPVLLPFAQFRHPNGKQGGEAASPKR